MTEQEPSELLEAAERLLETYKGSAMEFLDGIGTALADLEQAVRIERRNRNANPKR